MVNDTRDDTENHDIESEFDQESHKKVAHKKSRYDFLLGSFWMLVSVVMLATSTTFAKVVYMENPKLDGLDYMLIRSLVIAIVSTLEAWHFDVKIFDVPKEGRYYLALR